LFNLSGIAEIDAVGETDVIGTGRVEPVSYPLVAKVDLPARGKNEGTPSPDLGSRLFE